MEETKTEEGNEECLVGVLPFEVGVLGKASEGREHWNEDLKELR